MKTDYAQLYSVFRDHPRVSTDSRNVETGSLFFALKGDNFDGNRYAADALEKGAAFAIVDDKTLAPDNRLITVRNALETLQELALYHRKKLMIPIIGITGSNGKTTTKELISAVLSRKYRTFATRGNLNNHIGVPLSLLSIDSTHEIAVIEMGANHQREITTLSRIAHPDFGIITNIGKAHLEGFGGYTGVIKAKTELYKFISETHGKLFVNADDPLLMEKSAGINSIYYGNDLKAAVGGKITGKFPFVSAALLIQGKRIDVNSKLVGSFNLYNMLAAACIGVHFGVTPEQAAQALASYKPENHRSQWYETASNKIVMDAYNANPSSMKLALENFAESPFENKMLILGDMRELGPESPAEHTEIRRLISKLGFSDVVLVGPEFSAKENEQKPFTTFTNVDEAKAALRENMPSGKTILIKGSRGIQLEKLLEVL